MYVDKVLDHLQKSIVPQKVLTKTSPDKIVRKPTTKNVYRKALCTFPLMSWVSPSKSLRTINPKAIPKPIAIC
jgi:hypothetical protein